MLPSLRCNSAHCKSAVEIPEWLRLRFEAMHFCVRKQLQHDYGLVALVGSAIEHGGNGVLSCQALQIKQGVVPTLYVQAREAKNSVDRVGSWHAKGLFFEGVPNVRSEEHTSELQSLMRISYAVF